MLLHSFWLYLISTVQAGEHTGSWLQVLCCYRSGGIANLASWLLAEGAGWVSGHQAVTVRCTQQGSMRSC